MKALDRSVETLGLWIVTSSVAFIKSTNQSSIKLCLTLWSHCYKKISHTQTKSFLQVRQLVMAIRKVQSFGHFLKRKIPTSEKIFFFRACLKSIIVLMRAKQLTLNCWVIALSKILHNISTLFFHFLVIETSSTPWPKIKLPIVPTITRV